MIIQDDFNYVTGRYKRPPSQPVPWLPKTRVSPMYQEESVFEMKDEIETFFHGADNAIGNMLQRACLDDLGHTFSSQKSLKLQLQGQNDKI